MTVTPFPDRWHRKESQRGFPKTELVQCGGWLLPREAAPGITFDGATLPQPVWKWFGIADQWSSADRQRLDAHLVIGFDGAGNPLCIERRTGAIWLLDHEDRFHTRQFVNTGVPQLAECLLAYMGEGDAQRFRQAVNGIDPAALADGSFWSCEAGLIESD
jgi:hypothetical protein